MSWRSNCSLEIPQQTSCKLQGESTPEQQRPGPLLGNQQITKRHCVPHATLRRRRKVHQNGTVNGISAWFFLQYRHQTNLMNTVGSWKSRHVTCAHPPRPECFSVVRKLQATIATTFWYSSVQYPPQIEICTVDQSQISSTTLYKPSGVRGAGEACHTGTSECKARHCLPYHHGQERPPGEQEATVPTLKSRHRPFFSTPLRPCLTMTFYRFLNQTLWVIIFLYHSYLSANSGVPPMAPHPFTRSALAINSKQSTFRLKKRSDACLAKTGSAWLDFERS